MDRHRVAICRDWFCDPGFMNGEDTVVMLAESRSLLNSRVSRLPQVLGLEIPSPTEAIRLHYIRWFNQQLPKERKLDLWNSQTELSKLTAGLSIHALKQLLVGASHYGRKLRTDDVVSKVEQFIKDQLGEDVVEFKKPSHTLKDVVGFTGLKKFLKRTFIPRLKSTGKGALPGAAVCGPIGGGKSFIFEAVAGALGIVVLVLKNIRSQWFGQTDVVFERLRRVLTAVREALIFVDEADTQFGGVGEGTHATERRLTGKIQAMMADPALRGRVSWLLITARVHLLSPDIRRPGRVGSLIIPVLDPGGDDRSAFVRWMLKPVLRSRPDAQTIAAVEEVMPATSAAAFADIRSSLIAETAVLGIDHLSLEQALDVIRDHIPPDIASAREYQALQAKVNCTRRSLLPEPDVTEELRAEWVRRIRQLEAQGVS